MAGSTSLDVVLVQPGSRMAIYQELGTELTAVEPPVWAGLMATFLRNRGHCVGIVDAEAEELDPGATADRVAVLRPLLAVVVVFGHQPSASTQTMPAAGAICRALKERAPGVPTLMVGGHVSALPERTLREEACDFVCQGEGPYTIAALVEALRSSAPALEQVPGLWYRDGGAIRSTPGPALIGDLDAELPAVAWDLLPMSRYRAHNWHCFDDLARRRPYASIYTSLGCPFRCTFCCINAPFGKPGYRYRSARSVADEVDLLVERHQVRNVKILDEMFVLNDRHVLDVCDTLAARGYDLNIWAYARVDTVKEHILDRLKRAGINWLSLGIESGSKHVRDGALKKFGQDDIKQTVGRIKAAGIHVIGNFIFGLPDDDLETMQATLDLALELRCEFANFYAAMAYPGSRLYELALQEGWSLPRTWSGYSQHAEDTLPLPTKFVSAGQVLHFRDEAFRRYFSDPGYLEMVGRQFGPDTVEHVRRVAGHRLVRRHAAPLPASPPA